ncbi:hypothetical protein DOK76_05535 [Vagococcus sp. DIV0080]|uniref:HrgC protein n=1 Tax=Candidatus Vagococcus giribetii TaxID=2230876 RepID=A0ABS3HTG4_9ENTE|nr:hypothetical protein [Vagococcus sp. DIV0080]MBO0476522.1 hypothetical protein [Vagococcus sp. DIV0080]
MTITLVNPDTRQGKQVKVGFSWTVFFFGSFPALFRGDLKWFFIMFLANIFTAGLSHFVFMFIYNKLYITDLLNQGYGPVDAFGEQVLLSKGFFIPRNDYRRETSDDFDDLDF